MEQIKDFIEECKSTVLLKNKQFDIGEEIYASNLMNLYSIAKSRKETSFQYTHKIKKLVVVSIDNKIYLGSDTGDASYSCVLNDWALGQLCKLIKAPKAYIKSLPISAAVECLKSGLALLGNLKRESNIQVYVQDNIIKAITTERYERIYNSDFIKKILNFLNRNESTLFFNQPRIANDIDNAHLFLSINDNYMSISLLHKSKIIIDDETYYPGLMFWNSETGYSKIGFKTFLYRGVCSNKMIFGMKEFNSDAFVHTRSAHNRLRKALNSYDYKSLFPISSNVLMYDALKRMIHNLKSEYLNVNLKRYKVDYLNVNNLRNNLKSIGMQEALAYSVSNYIRDVRSIDCVSDLVIKYSWWDCIQDITSYAKTLSYAEQRFKCESYATNIFSNYISKFGHNEIYYNRIKIGANKYENRIVDSNDISHHPEVRSVMIKDLIN